MPNIEGTITQYKTTYDIDPHAGAADFDNSKWEIVQPKDLAGRRSGGHVAFMWYRTPLTIPAKIGAFDPSGAVAVLRVTVDDYAEVWVNGAIPGRSGYPRPASIQGHNTPNRVRSAPVRNPATSSRSRSSASTARSRSRRPIPYSFARQSWSCSSSDFCDKARLAPAGTLPHVWGSQGARSGCPIPPVEALCSVISPRLYRVRGCFLHSEHFPERPAPAKADFDALL